ncbi:MAG: GNAT family N-acetyltransferase [Chloroflexi bacterium]|nr:GNAT family N-acetyltransferase [Chloroflexota bacterium]
MVQREAKTETILQDLGDGLILRHATIDDAEALANFNGMIHGRQEPDKYVAAWTRDLISGRHPTFTPGDFLIVEDTRNGSIVSSVNLISQVWRYAGIEFGVGRPELVGILPDYRHRGLVRAQFEVIHRWSAARGEMLQAIKGIPWYYRQFGYEMGLELGGGRIGYRAQVPQLKERNSLQDKSDALAQEPYLIRPATESDIPFMAQLYAGAMDRYLLACRRDAALWQYELRGRHEDCLAQRELRIIEDQQGEPVGLLGHSPWLWGGLLSVMLYEVKPGVSWLKVTPSVLRYLQSAGEACAAQREAQSNKKEHWEGFWFGLGTDHPVYQAIPHRLPEMRKPYAWYVRVPDLPAFLRLIKPVLEERLRKSILVGHSGKMHVSFDRSGFRMIFDQGQLVTVEDWQPSPRNEEDAAFPNLTFLQLLFGYRTLDELRYAYADCWTNGDEAPALLDILFPKQNSDIWAVS